MLLCPKCTRPIPAEDINIARDTALCRGCDTVTAVSSVVHGQAAMMPTVFDPASPPAGAYVRDDSVETIIGATTRSGSAVFLVLFAAIWSGFSMWGVYGTQLTSGKFDPMLTLFGLPFIVGSAAIWAFAALNFAGRVEVRIRQGRGTVFVGVGSIGWKKGFDVAGVQAVREDWSGWSRNKKPRKSIVLEGATRISFGSLLTEPRRHFVMQALGSALKLP